MGDRTGISWTNATWNPVRGCSRVSEGCRNCYAERVAWRHEHRFVEVSIDSARTTTQTVAGPYQGLVRRGPTGPVWTGEVRFIEEALALPLRWRKPRRIFVNSMSDIFHEKVPDEWVLRIYQTMGAAHHHIYQILTKRPERMAGVLERITPILRAEGRSDPATWGHVHLGVSVEDQATAEARIPLLLRTPAALRFVSYEPALGPVDFSRWFLCAGKVGPCSHHRPSWFIIGGESGPNARPCDLAWIRSAIAQCRAAGVACFVKQLGACPTGEWGKYEPIPLIRETATCGWVHALRDRAGADPEEWPEDLRIQEWPQ